MRAALVRECGPIDRLVITEVPDPRPGPEDVVVDVFAAEANYPDVLVIEGTYQFKPPLPFSPGKSAAGRVAALGAGVTHLRVGDRVAVQVEHGAYAEKLCAPARSCFPMPAGMPFDKAAALGLSYQTAWFALKERARIQRGEVVVVLGASGGIGVASVQLAKAFGARSVLAGVRGEEEADVARHAGADHIVDLAAPDLHEALRDTVFRVTDGHGADIVMDPVGGAVTAAALRAMAWCGRLIIIGFASGEIPTIKANYLLVKNIAAIGLQVSDYRNRTPAQVAEAQREIFELYQAGTIDPYISRTLPLDRVHEALFALKEGKAQGKIILEVRKPTRRA